MFGLGSRCIYCKRLIWPWQKMGWQVLGKSIIKWHPRCYTIYSDLSH